MSNQDEDDTGVGYGRPPKHSQFKKGQSGNPSGRKKRDKKIVDSNPVREVLLEDVVTTSKGAKKKMPIVKAIIRLHAALALKGDHKSANLLLDRCGDLETLLLWKPGKVQSIKPQHRNNESRGIQCLCFFFAPRSDTVVAI